jgi:selenocysteine lyase/cysteine desulfurase
MIYLGSTSPQNQNDLQQMEQTTTLEQYFSEFRNNTIGNHQTFQSGFGKKKLVYADWTASGRAYAPIEEYIQNSMLPFMANTHTGTTISGKTMTEAYEEAKSVVKDHVNANPDDVLIFCGSGMTGAVNKLQRLMGLRLPERLMDYLKADHLSIDESLRPVVFLSHMEHHSNQVSWLETIATVELILPDAEGQVDIEHFKQLLKKYKSRKNKILAITACSNVTGIQTPYHPMAKLIHAQGGLCFVDFACSAPLIDMDMHPDSTGSHLDAIYFSPHKFLGGPGTAGVLIFNKNIYRNSKPDQPGGGTLLYTNPWKDREYMQDIEQREDGGTPPILPGIRVAMCIRLKEKMGSIHLLKREEELLERVFDRLSKIENIEILAGHIKKRLGVFSFIVKGAHHNLIVKILNDRFGIQTRGGCSCAGTYGHWLMNISKDQSYKILNMIRSGDLSGKPGWIRLSIHPTMTNREITFITDAIELTAKHYPEWKADYTYEAESNEFIFTKQPEGNRSIAKNWFDPSSWDH